MKVSELRKQTVWECRSVSIWFNGRGKYYIYQYGQATGEETGYTSFEIAKEQALRYDEY